MSRRTSEASKAIRAAWQKERELVSEGKGTRDWTPEQQKEILELGKAYYHSDDPDDINDGKAFEGHHMKSAEAYHEYQGCSDNIQFLTRSEHQEAHGGDYRNPTNGYFDPVSRITHNFGDSKYEPCKIIELTNPIVDISNFAQATSKTVEGDIKETAETDSIQEAKDECDTLEAPGSQVTTDAISSPKTRKGFREKILDVVETLKVFSEKHPNLTGIFKVAVTTAIAVASDKISDRISESFSNPKVSSAKNDFNDNSDNYNVDTSDADDNREVLIDREYPIERLSPKEHTVPAHGQHYHTKNGVIWKEKDPYLRGGKNEGE